jgi:hypothetical protein
VKSFFQWSPIQIVIILRIIRIQDITKLIHLAIHITGTTGNHQIIIGIPELIGQAKGMKDWRI